MSTPSQSDIAALFEYYQSARYNDACNLAIAITEQYPDHQFAWKILGAVLRTMGNMQGALFANEAAARLDPHDAEALYNLSNLLKELGRLEDAEIGYKKSISLKPDFAEAHLNLGVVLQEQGQLEDAQSSYRAAIACRPHYVEPHNNLGNVLRDLGRYEDAETHYKKAIALKPDYVEAHSNLGIALQKAGRLQDAEICYQNAIAMRPSFAAAHYNLGTLFQESFRFSEAESSYRQAIDLKSDYAEAYHNLGLVLLELGDAIAALQMIVQSIQISPSIDAKALFVEILKNISATFWDSSLSNVVTQALLEPWGKPIDISGFACQLLKSDPEIQRKLNVVKGETFEGLDLIKQEGSLPKKDIPSYSLLIALLTTGPVPDIELEEYLTGLRYALLENIDASPGSEAGNYDEESFYCALARQCFINEYIYYQTPEEISSSIDLRDRVLRALADGEEIPVRWILAVASYFPLYSLQNAKSLLGKSYSAEVMAVLKQQIQEPLEEIELRCIIPSLTKVDNQISVAVQSQYEQNPYPRWVSLPRTFNSKFLNSFIAKKFPLSGYQPQADDRNLEVLIAGCGTGQHSIACAQLIRGAKILAIDLSISSLAYAKRKTLEMGIDSIEYAQADLLKLASAGREFDLIESVGVLHHMDKPFDGWEVLVSILRPNGLMRLGFYSELARQDIVRVREFISRDNVESSSQGIRNYRHHLLKSKDSHELKYAREGIDFYSMSTCRDLIFHVQEHRMQLGEIAQFLERHQLKFLGFDIDRKIIQSYKERFPEDLSASNLQNWAIYEHENPQTFLSMYQFLVQKST